MSVSINIEAVVHAVLAHGEITLSGISTKLELPEGTFNAA